ncbi:putative RING-H2 finger protein ATL19 [Humulus lupulus]|uniref:putative RING-H2 finger protein ATL19 n=1 Tax=Humulus lupulus TaxID=3486 RepID=UPI002B411C67|nr:putative RING-H2 finger protein ATL19 [Humulus lupulus]
MGNILFINSTKSQFNDMLIFSQGLSIQYTITLDLLTTLTLCLTIALCVVLLYQILFNFLSWLLDVRPDRSTEDVMYTPRLNHTNMSHQAAFYRTFVQYNVVQVVDMLERFVRDIDERRGPRLRALNRLPPLISYGSHERMCGRSSRGDDDECVICLEDFEEGESCQVFPVCNHIFHTNCIDHWLKNRPTCPVCRHCILDV